MFVYITDRHASPDKRNRGVQSHRDTHSPRKKIHVYIARFTQIDIHVKVCFFFNIYLSYSERNKDR